MEHLYTLSLAPRIVNHVLRSRWSRAAWPPTNGAVQMSASQQMKEARRDLERQGFTATKTRGGHWRFEHSDMDGPVFAADTPSDYRAIKNLYAMLRRKTRRPKAA